MKLIVTLNDTDNRLDFAERAREKGADLLEIRDDISPIDLDLTSMRKILPLLVSRRKQQPLSRSWISQAEYIDQEIALPAQKLDFPVEKQIFSHHALLRMSVIFAVEMWRERCEGGQCIKHIEPHGPDSMAHLNNLRELLKLISDKVTVLPMGKGAEEARVILSRNNHLHYCKLDESSASAPGQEQLELAVARFKSEAQE